MIFEEMKLSAQTNRAGAGWKIWGQRCCKVGEEEEEEEWQMWYSVNWVVFEKMKFSPQTNLGAGWKIWEQMCCKVWEEEEEWQMWDQLDGFGRHLHQKVVSAEAFSRPSKYKKIQKYKRTEIQKCKNAFALESFSAKSSYPSQTLWWADNAVARKYAQSSKFRSSVAWFLAKF